MTKKEAQTTLSKIEKWLSYIAIGLLIVNIIFIKIPFVEVYQPTQSKTNPLLGTTTYDGWITETASMADFIFPVLFLIPYIMSLAYVTSKVKKTEEKLSNNHRKNQRGLALTIIAGIANLISMYVLYNNLSEKANVYAKHGGYCDFTALGIFNIILTIFLLLIIAALIYVDNRQINIPVEANETEILQTEEDHYSQIAQEASEEKKE